MGSKLTKLLKNVFCRKKLNICMLGLESSGKTTILYKFHLGEVLMTTPTIGFNIEVIKYKQYNLSIFDICGDMRHRTFWATYYKGADGLIYVIDSANKDNIEIAKEELYKVLGHESIKNVPILVLANKQDLIGAMSSLEVLEKMMLYKIRDRAWHLEETCALSGEGLEQGLNRLIQMMRCNRS